MRRLRILVGAALLLLLALTPAVASAQSPGYRHLNPGGPTDYREEVPVNVVFVGYETDDVDADEFLAGLPESYQPVNVIPTVFYDEQPDALGIDYTYDYQLTYADQGYEDAFFSELTALALPETLTVYQAEYNAQETNVLDVTDNHWIDAPSVERWLADNPPAGVDTRENTIFFVNWYGRDDFLHHVYTKTGEPDPDTGYDFGLLRDSRKMIAWGGTPPDDEETGSGRLSRVWFHDLSAGPESWTGNYIVDVTDLDGNGVEDYRMPPIWEYTEGGYRDPAALSGDLSKITRYVGIDLLFTASPIYAADLTPPALPETIDLDSNTYEGWQGVDASEQYVTPDLLLSEESELRPLNTFSYDNQDLPFRGGRARQCYVLWLQEVPCVPELDYPGFANLFVYNALTLERTQDDAGAVDYELPMFNYSVGQPRLQPFLLGYADDNYRDGTQSFVFNFISPGIVESGYGLTTTMIHEAGHHLGMSHPHDGWDSEQQQDINPADEFFFVWAGDETNSMMSYIDVNWDFSQFDRDNSNRFNAEAYGSNANVVAGLVLDAGGLDQPRVRQALRRADLLLGLSEEAFARHRYLAAADLAKRAYEATVQAANLAGVPVEPSYAGWQVDTTRPAEAAGLEKLPYVVDPVTATEKRNQP